MLRPRKRLRFSNNLCYNYFKQTLNLSNVEVAKFVRERELILD